MTYTEKRLEAYDQGVFSKVAQDDWNEENVKGYLAAQDDIRPFLIESITQARAEERARVRGEIEKAVIETKDTKDFATRMFQITMSILASPDKPLT